MPPGSDRTVRVAVVAVTVAVATAAAAPATGALEPADGVDQRSEAATPTFVEENVTTDTTWTASEGPYRVIKDVTVTEGATLRIQAGTTVQVADGVTITVRGSLVAEGTAENPVEITSGAESPSPGAWGTIRYDASRGTELTLRHATVSYATTGITAMTGSGSVTVEGGGVVHSSKNGIYVRTRENVLGEAVPRAPTLTVRNANVSGNGANGIDVAGPRGRYKLVQTVSGWTIADSTFRNNEFAGVSLSANEAVADPEEPPTIGDTTVSGNVFVGNRWGIRMDAGRVREVTVSDNEVRDSEKQGIRVVTWKRLSSLTVRGNVVTGSGQQGIAIRPRRESSGLTIADNRVAGNGADGGRSGITIEHEGGDTGGQLHGLSMNDNVVVNNSRHGIVVSTDERLYDVTVSGGNLSANREVGLLLAPELRLSKVRVENVVAANNRQGIEFRSNAEIRDVSVVDSTIRSNGDRSDTEGGGLFFREASEEYEISVHDVTIAGNRVLDNSWEGIYVRGQTYHEGPVEVRDNVVVGNRYGIRVRAEDGAGGPHAKVVGNTIAFNYHALVPEQRGQDGAGIRVESANNTASKNDVYGNRVGLLAERGSIAAENNYWGASGGPYHESANPQGEGNAVVGSLERADFVPFSEERFGKRLRRPTAELGTDRKTAVVNEPVTVPAGPSSDPDGSVETYVLFVDPTDRVVRSTSSTPTLTFDDDGTYNVTLAVEDDAGIDSNGTATMQVVVEESTPTPTVTSTPTDGSTTSGGDDDGDTATAAPGDGGEGGDGGDGGGADGGDDGGSSSSTPGFTVVTALLALTAVVYYRRRRR